MIDDGENENLIHRDMGQVQQQRELAHCPVAGAAFGGELHQKHQRQVGRRQEKQIHICSRGFALTPGKGNLQIQQNHGD